MTPNDIEILIHCYVSPEPHPRIEHNRDVLEDFIVKGLVRHKGGDIYETTEKGAAHIIQICRLPLPKKKYIGYDGKEIILG